MGKKVKHSVLKILKVSAVCSIQDAGRPGYKSWGICESGYMDERSAAMANRLVGNLLTAPVLELGTSAFSAEIAADAVHLSYIGPGARFLINQKSVPTDFPHRLQKGDVIQCDVQLGNYGYLAVNGGWEQDPVLGSRSYHSACYSKPVERGQVLYGGNQGAFSASLAGIDIPRSPAAQRVMYLQVDLGPEFERLTLEARRNLFAGHYVLSADLSRVGFRLVGPSLTFENDAPMHSSSVFPGVVQVPPSGQPIVLMKDAPVTGGYPRILVIRRYELSVLSQAKPGSVVKFVRFKF